MASVYRLYGARNLVLDQEDIDSASLGPDEFLAETQYTAISPGTEVAAYRGLPVLRPGPQYPRLVGYCNVARVTAIGSEVEKVSVGDGVLTFQSHRSAFVCKESAFCVKLPAHANWKHAATTYLYHLGYHALLSAQARASERIAVIGLGTLGATCLRMASIIGCRPTGFTEQAAPDGAFGTSGIALERKSAPSSTSTFDVVVNTSNEWRDWKLALELVNEGGRIVNLGFPGRGLPPPDFNPLDSSFVYTKSVSILPLCLIPEYQPAGSPRVFSLDKNCQYLLDLADQGLLRPTEIISGESDYRELGQVYERYVDRSKPLFSTVLCWRPPC